MRYYLTETVEKSNHKLWKGGKYKQGGYVMVKVEYHPSQNCRGYIQEHRLVMEHNLQRYLNKDEVVHHKNGIKDDNRIENLELMYNDVSHARKHNKNIKKDEKGRMLPSDPILGEIKFRLFNKDRGDIKEYSLSKLINTTFRKGCFEFRGRSTGLKDKNGKLIFEGDIVKVCGTKELVITEIDIKDNCIVKWDKKSAVYFCDVINKREIKLTEHGCYEFDYLPLFQNESDKEMFDFEILGNIFENQELLGEGK